MSRQSWQETLVQANADGTAISATVTQATLLPPEAIYTLPGGSLQVGSMLKVNAWGRVSNVVTTPGTILFQLLFGATAVYNNAAATIALNAAAKTNVAWFLELIGTVRAIGPSANIMWQGQWTSESVVGAAAGTAASAFLPASAPAVGSNFDSRTSQAVDLQAKFSVATAGTAIQLHQYMLQALN